MLNWREQYSIANDEIDRQHQHILMLMNSVETAATSGDGSATIDLVLSHLTRYIRLHFNAEERLMELVGYPEIDRHRAEHTRCKAEVDALVDRIHSGAVPLTAATDFLRHWLHNHLLHSDSLLTPWVLRAPEVTAQWAASSAVAPLAACGD